MLYVIAFYDEARLVPMIERQHDPGRCAVERVRGRGGREATAAVRRVLVIEELIFRAAPVDMIVLACAAVKDTAVASLADLPLELELEISKALLRNQIIYRAVLGEHPAGDVPARRQSGLFPAAPVGRAVLLQERTPGCCGRVGPLCCSQQRCPTGKRHHGGVQRNLVHGSHLSGITCYGRFNFLSSSGGGPSKLASGTLPM